SIGNIGSRRNGAVGVSISFDVDAVMEIRDVVERNNVAGPIEFHRNIGRHLRREDLPLYSIESSPKLWTIPTDELVGIVSSIEPVIRNVEIAGAGIVREDPGADVFETALLDSQAFRARKELSPGQNAVLRIPESQAFKVRV